MKKLTVLILSLFLLSPLACDDDSGNNGNNSNLTNAEFLELLSDEYVDGYCSFLGRCPQADGEEWMASESSCRAIMGEFLLAEAMMEMEWALENGTNHSVSNLNACMSALNTIACDADPDSIQACRQVFTGTIADGAACSTNFQCTSGYCKTDVSCPGVCTPTVGAGQPCDDGDECNAGLICDWNLESPVCATAPAKAAQGEACEWHDNCEYGLFCLITDFETYVGVCQPWMEAGDICDGDGAMEVVCEPGLACDSTSGECATVTTVGVGQTCDNETRVCDFTDHAMCLEGMVDGTCTVIPSDGDACMQGYCWPGNYCGEDDICHPAMENGEACTDHDQCRSEWCNVNVCDYAPCHEDEMD